MGIEIRLGTEKDLDVLEKLYDNLNEYLEATTNYPGWKKGIYPVREDAAKGINEGCLYVATQKNEIVGAMILRHKSEPAYSSVTWQMKLEDNQVLALYTFVVNPNYLHQGIGKEMLEFASQHALNMKVKALRLDVYEKNIPAIRLYEKCGYQYIDTVSLGLEEYGLNWFKLYEKLIEIKSPVYDA